MSRESQLDICEECGEALDLHETLCLSAAADVLPLFEAREERLRAEVDGARGDEALRLLKKARAEHDQRFEPRIIHRPEEPKP